MSRTPQAADTVERPCAVIAGNAPKAIAKRMGVGMRKQQHQNCYARSSLWLQPAHVFRHAHGHVRVKQTTRATQELQPPASDRLSVPRGRKFGPPSTNRQEITPRWMRLHTRTHSPITNGAPPCSTRWPSVAAGYYYSHYSHYFPATRRPCRWVARVAERVRAERRRRSLTRTFPHKPN